MKQKTTFAYLAVSLLSVAVTALAWVLNFGWFRLFLLAVMAPIIHAAIFVAVNMFAASFFSKCPKIRIVNLFFVITYILPNILFPDAGDSGATYSCFGLIDDISFTNFAWTASALLFVVHIVLLAVQIVMMINVKYKLKRAERKGETTV